MQRLIRNLARLPLRAVQGMSQLISPVHRLQRKADRVVPRLFGAERLVELLAIPGFSSRRELHLLVYLATEAPTGGCFLEIGAYKGRSTAWLVEAAQLCPEKPAVVSIDPHHRKTWESFQQIVEQFRLRERGLEVFRAYSHDVGRTWNRPVSLLWVDGSHEYEDVLRDIILFTPHVVLGGWVVFDDARGGKFPGVERAIAERMTWSRGFIHVGAVKHFELFRREVPCPERQEIKAKSREPAAPSRGDPLGFAWPGGSVPDVCTG
jgi:predicted O-methyltransferase YrrM